VKNTTDQIVNIANLPPTLVILTKSVPYSWALHPLYALFWS
jgi:hypothetical protein